MKKNKLMQLFDFQKFERNPSLAFAIESTKAYIDSKAQKKELSLDELEMLSAAGQPAIKKKKDLV